MEPTKSVETENIDQPKSTNGNVMSKETVVKVMGVTWDKSEDCFKFDLTVSSKQTLSGTLTKRKLLSVTTREKDYDGKSRQENHASQETSQIVISFSFSSINAVKLNPLPLFDPNPYPDKTHREFPRT